MPVTVLVVDDSDLMRRAIISLLERSSEIQLVGEASSFNETIQLLGKVRPHVLVLDLFMRDGTNATMTEFKSSSVGVCVVAISASNNDEVRALAENVGATKLLDKMNLWNELIPAIKECAAGQPTD
jgi:DNA-binding NarL/FixJ family response regulator